MKYVMLRLDGGELLPLLFPEFMQHSHIAQSVPATVVGDVTLTANTALYSSRKNLAPREINDLGCAKAGLVGHPNGYTQLM